MRKFVLPIIFILIALVYSSIVVVTEGTRGIMLRQSTTRCRQQSGYLYAGVTF